MVGEEAKNISVTEGKDLISALPDPLVGAIISLLPNTEGVRTCVFSKRWKKAWMHMSHLNIDQVQMMKPFIQANLCGVHHKRCVDVPFQHQRVDPNENYDLDVIDKTERLIISVLNSHSHPLESCNIRHLPESCASGNVVLLMKKLLKEKNLKKLSMEQTDPIHWDILQNAPQGVKYHEMTIDLPFEIFSSFEELELKNYYLKTKPSSGDFAQVLKKLTFKNMMVDKDDWEGIMSYCLCLENLTIDNCMMEIIKINNPRLKFLRICRMEVIKIDVSAINLEIIEIDTVVCKPQKVTFETPKVHFLRSCFDAIGGQNDCWVRSKLLQSENILHACCSNKIPQGSTSSFANIFENLATLCIGLDLEKLNNAMSLYSTLKSCPMLQTLEINIQADDDAWDYHGDEDEEEADGDARDYDGDEHNEEGYFPYPKIFFWMNMDPCDCINHKLKTLSIKGFAGEELEVEFLKYIITTAKVMKKITIWFVDNCSWAQATKTRCLMSFKSISPNLSIILNPGPIYMANGDGNFETWMSTLRN
ncbi:hypothetical protein AAZX31_08G166500 [Glycine max]|uniref:Uncharacterized protein n=1 Tax=Glycine max TaxID=3847 RepID=K7L769_SOYBN|nr:hypothetical protein GLYMA_08G168500v4 [Glycine max]KAG5000440.1 hypothetical protein JHK87_021512 [Glycine soja]KAH1051616.1 hypothetical protein GYH30_021491 [Glycine max]KAH1051617.1 hypothetical protein GYH30_021491 [Glycine max]KAH1237458.1 F-box protein [Glycine max]|eukprot:XP_014634522.1 F-box protein At1g80960 [Glycine max]